MSANKQALDEVMNLVKGLRETVKTLADSGKSNSEALEARVQELISKRDKTIEDVLAEKFRKGEHLAPIDDEKAEPSEMLVSKSEDKKVQEWQKINDDVYILSKIMKRHPSQTKLYQKIQPRVSELRKALNVTNATEGQNWVPTEFSADLIDKFRLSLKVANLFERMVMPSNPFKMPVVGGDATGYLISESTSDTATKITASQPTTNNLELSAKKLAARTIFSEEMSEDSIIPTLPFLKDHLVRIMADTFENAIINGDTSGSHMDIDVTTATDARKAYLGLRKQAKTFNNLKDLSTFNLANVRSIRTAMGKYGVNPADLVWITGPKGYAKLIGLDEVITMEKYGSAATVLTGELGRLDGIPIVVSEHVRENLSTTGYYDGTTTNNTVLILAWRPGFIIGDRRKMTLKTFEDIQTDQTILVATMRHAFDSFYDESTQGIVNVGRDVDAA